MYPANTRPRQCNASWLSVNKLVSSSSGISCSAAFVEPRKCVFCFPLALFLTRPTTSTTRTPWHRRRLGWKNKKKLIVSGQGTFRPAQSRHLRPGASGRQQVQETEMQRVCFLMVLFFFVLGNDHRNEPRLTPLITSLLASCRFYLSFHHLGMKKRFWFVFFFSVEKLKKIQGLLLYRKKGSLGCN